MPNLLLGVLRPAFAPAPVGGLAGYVCGGELEPVGTPTDTTFKLAFATDTWGSTTAAPDVIVITAGFSDDGVAGYCAQGELSDELYKWTLPTDSSSRTTDIPDELEFVGAFSNRGVAGYIASSVDVGSGDPTPLHRLAYPTDSFTTPINLPAGQENTGGDADAGVAGYMPRKGTFPGDGVWNKVALPTESASVQQTFLFTDFTDGPSVFCDPGVKIYATNAETDGITFNVLTLPTDSPNFAGFATGPSEVFFGSGFANDGVAGYAQIGEDGDTGDASDEVYKLAFPTASSFAVSDLPVAKIGAGGFANMG